MEITRGRERRKKRREETRYLQRDCHSQRSMASNECDERWEKKKAMNGEERCGENSGTVVCIDEAEEREDAMCGGTGRERKENVNVYG